MCSICRRELDAAREWRIEVQRREAALTSAKQREAECRARAADHAAQHPYRYDGGN